MFYIRLNCSYNPSRQSGSIFFIFRSDYGLYYYLPLSVLKGISSLSVLHFLVRLTEIFFCHEKQKESFCYFSEIV